MLQPAEPPSQGTGLYFYHSGSGSLVAHRCEDEQTLPYDKESPKDLSLTPSGCLSFGNYFVLDLCLVAFPRSENGIPEEYPV